jgi:ABC-type polysaccharide/polyol phosphate transport system ATPase subunit
VTAPAVVADGVTKVYRRFLHQHQFRTLKSALLTGSLITDLRPDETFTALDGVSFEVPRGTTFGVIGENGSGKSTLLKLLAGITKPTRGALRVAGRISALIELGAGFHPEISGRENVAINGIMLGLTRREVDERFDEIVDFAELREFIDAPVKTYSSGMYMRLGFAVAINVNPDVLLVDEVLAVGDEGFTHKCLDKFAEFKRSNKTILLVTHSLNLIERFCDEALWLDDGQAMAHGDPKRVVGAYLTKVEEGEEALLASTTAKAVEEASKRDGQEGRDEQERRDGQEPTKHPTDPTSNMFQATEGRWGSRDVEITDVAFLDREGQACFVFHSGDALSIRVKVRATQPTDDFVFGIGLFNAEGMCVYGTNTYLEDMNPERLDGEAEATFAIDSLDLVEGTYKIDAAVHKRDGFPYDYHRLLYTFRVKSRTHDVGIYRPRHRWSFSPNVTFKSDR